MYMKLARKLGTWYIRVLQLATEFVIIQNLQNVVHLQE